jgi:peptide deformylase
MANLFQKGDKVLRQKAREIKKDEISSTYLKNLYRDMKEVLEKEKDGFAIAAPQIGESLRVFLVSGLLFQHLKKTDEPQPDMIYLNPVIIKKSKETELMEEGCLSVRGWYGKVERNKKIKIEAVNDKGVKFQEGASGLKAQVFQHEIDHLNGILFTDKAIDLERIEPPTN